MTDEQDKGIAIVRQNDGKVMPSTEIPKNLWAYADQVPVEKSIEALTDEFHRTQLADDKEGIGWRPKQLKVNHSSGTFDLSDMGMIEYSPAEIFCNVMAHRANRALWKLTQDENDKRPHCSSTDAIEGSMRLADGSRVKCEDCIYGRWWNPIELLEAIGNLPELYANLGKYINSKLGKNTTIASLAAEDPDRNIPPPCKEVRRLFIFALDDKEKGILDQPLTLQVPPSSVSNWDKYRDGLSQYKIKTSRGLIPVTLITGITSITLTKEEMQGTTFSRFNFKYSNRVLPADFVLFCDALANDWGPEIMDMEIIRDDFNVSTGVDPTTLSEKEKSRSRKKSADLAPDIILDGDVGDDIDNEEDVVDYFE